MITEIIDALAENMRLSLQHVYGTNEGASFGFVHTEVVQMEGADIELPLYRKGRNCTTAACGDDYTAVVPDDKLPILTFWKAGENFTKTPVSGSRLQYKTTATFCIWYNACRFTNPKPMDMVAPLVRFIEGYKYTTNGLSLNKATALEVATRDPFEAYGISNKQRYNMHPYYGVEVQFELSGIVNFDCRSTDLIEPIC
jgi:hypothetical protein